MAKSRVSCIPNVNEGHSDCALTVLGYILYHRYQCTFTGRGNRKIHVLKNKKTTTKICPVVVLNIYSTLLFIRQASQYICFNIFEAGSGALRWPQD